MYKNIPRKKYFKRLGGYMHSYAFVGAGKHSIDNLYPCIHHLGIPLKFICTQNISSASNMSALFPGCAPIDTLEPILLDPKITGVFVCLPPEQHFGVVKRLLENNKNVFVEKPVCHSVQELSEIMNVQKNSFCQVGLQRRFSKVFGLLKKLSGGSISYNYRFLVGAYPEGDELFNIFIHPIDFVVQLFGAAKIEHITVTGTPGMSTYFIVLDHGRTVGTIELSTNHTWLQPVDEITVTTASRIISARYPDHLSAVSRPAAIMNIPHEKIFKYPLKKLIYLNHDHFTPTGEFNSLNLQGFYPEIVHFADAVEQNRPDEHYGLKSVLPVYEILEQFRKTSRR